MDHQYFEIHTTFSEHIHFMYILHPYSAMWNACSILLRHYRNTHLQEHGKVQSLDIVFIRHPESNGDITFQITLKINKIHANCKLNSMIDRRCMYDLYDLLEANDWNGQTTVSYTHLIQPSHVLICLREDKNYLVSLYQNTPQLKLYQNFESVAM